ncbi:hypothetical protein EDD86DRAFT_275424 [Gorgonomyces haynaldii]|nr:hypothetical protein EDD86DRAFT_275424 [Gorgonomyces haynaldii]
MLFVQALKVSFSMLVGSRSHVEPYLSIGQELDHRGHHVQFHHTVEFESMLENRPFLQPVLVPNLQSQSTVQTIVERLAKDPSLQGPHSIATAMKTIFEAYPEMYAVYYSIFQQEKPDLVFCTAFVLGCVDAANDLNRPVIVLSLIGITESTWYTPSLFVPHTQDEWLSSLSLRLSTYVTQLPMLLSLVSSLSLLQNRRRLVGTNATYGMQSVTQNFVVFTPQMFGLEYAVPLPPNIFMLGPLVDTSRSHFEPDMQSLFDSFERQGHHVVFVSFGSVLRGQTALSDSLVKTFDLLLKQDPHVVVVWSTKDTQPNSLSSIYPNRFHVVPWIRQQAVLRHNVTRLFVSHCGLSSATEAVYFGKPVLAIPLFGDQQGNAHRLRAAGMAQVISDVDPIKTSKTITELLHDTNHPMYLNAKRMHQIAVLTQMDKSHLGANVAEIVATVGWSHLIPAILLD